MRKHRVVCVLLLLLSGAACPVPQGAITDDRRGGTVALLLDRKSLAVDESATLRDRMSFSNDGIVTVKLTFDDEKVIQVDLRFPKGTPIPVATTELARSLIRKGLDVNFVPEVGAVRINFAPGLKDASANASTTTFVEIHYGKRDEFGRDKRLGLPASCSEIH